MSSSSDERLVRYRQMRDFGTTPEPSGASESPVGSAPAFTVQRHAARRLHYDFRLEVDGVLRSWAVPKGPSLDPGERRLAVETEDHPLAYGEFEGRIPPRQYGAGEVVLWDRGTWSTDEADPGRALERGKLKFRLNGVRLGGGWTLVRMGGTPEKARNWLLIKERDEAARTGAEAEITERESGSVRAGAAPAAAVPKAKAVAPKSGRGKGSADPPAAPQAALPVTLAPQLATLVQTAPTGRDWVYEIKYDGYRILARVARGKASLFTRNGHDWSARLRHLQAAIEALGVGDSWLDGEIIVAGADGLPDFQALQNAFDAGQTAPIRFCLFDAPWLDGQDLRAAPLLERKRCLAAVLEGHAGVLSFSEHFGGNPAEALAQACSLSLEGLIGKRADAAYSSGRNASWVKLKCRPRQEFVIGGYSAPAGSRQGFGALLVGLHDADGVLHYAGRVGTGFDDATLARLAPRLVRLHRAEAPFARAPRAADVHWVKPELVAEVAFAGWTRERLLRQASFIALRTDKPARAVGMEAVAEVASARADGLPKGTVAADAMQARPAAAPKSTAAAKGAVRVAGVTISHPDRVVWPDVGVTKADLARYYETVGAYLLPQLAARPLSLLRCPDGSAAECFFQRHMWQTRGQARPAGVEEFVWESSSGSRRSYLYVTDLDGVIGMVQRGVIEFHTWGSTLPRADRADRLTFDLDPAPELPWAQVVEGARLVRGLLAELGLDPFLKTTGGKGLHLVVPLARRHRWDEVKAFARAVATHLAGVLPQRFTASMSKERRVGRIFVDYLRNEGGATAVAAYSVRARPGAPVSTPIAWDELDAGLNPLELNVGSVPARLAALTRDPWADYAETRHIITRAMRRAVGDER